jgi:hypothetical protein
VRRVVLFRDAGLAARNLGRIALTHRHFNLAKQRHSLLRAEPLLQHDQLLSKTVSLKPPGTKRPGQVNTKGVWQTLSPSRATGLH